MNQTAAKNFNSWLQLYSYVASSTKLCTHVSSLSYTLGEQLVDEVPVDSVAEVTPIVAWVVAVVGIAFWGVVGSYLYMPTRGLARAGNIS